MDMQKLFDMIERVSDRSDALNTPNLKEILHWIRYSGLSDVIYDGGKADKIIDQLRTASPNTWFEIRDLRYSLIRHIVAVICEDEGMDLVYRFPNSDRSLHVNLVVRETHTGNEAVYGIFNNDPSCPDESVWEYVSVNCSRLFDAIRWRKRNPKCVSIYGWSDPININQPSDY
ncbi:hypothetical protein [Pseudomonas aeruginosa]|uniref:hypothetical protein n=1 Tax=Pseudomonas aeruginosa TaxID=287 RepID=UPI003FD5E037